MAKETNQSRAEGRPARVPVSSRQNITTVYDSDPNYVYRWVNDVEDRIERFKLGGWEIVDSKSVKVGQRSLDNSGEMSGTISRSVGAGRTAFLMRIKKEWFDEDQAEKARQIQESEDAMLRKEKNAEGRYGSLTMK